MADKEESNVTEASLSVRTAILEAIKASVSLERTINLTSIGGLANAVNVLADTNLYSKGPVGDNYAKNSQRQAFDADVIRTVEGIREAIKTRQ